MFRFWLAACAVISSTPWVAAAQQVRGVVVDVTGAAIGGATVRLLKSVSEEAAHATATKSGRFQLETVAPGSYVLVAWQQGFRSRRLTVVVSRAGEALDLGYIRLNAADCDAPGVICDTFGESPPPDTVVSRGNLQMQSDCMAAFAASRVFCHGDPSGGREADADIRLSHDENGVYLTAMNGALFSEPDLPRGDCREAHPKEKQLRIDGLGRGDDICLYTHDRHWSHMFFTDAINRGSRQIAFWQITRKR